MTNQLNILLLSLGALQGVIISFFLLWKKPRHLSNTFFILFLLVVGLQLTFKVISKGWLWNHVLLFYFLSYSLPFLAGPFLYLFLRSRTNVYEFRLTDLKHFIPFVICLLHYLVADFYKFNYLPKPYPGLIPWQVLQLIWLFGYGIASWKLIGSEGKLANSLKKFLVWVVSAEAIIIVTIALTIQFHKSLPDVRLLFIVLTVLIYWISYQLISQPEAFIRMPEIAMVPLRTENTTKYAHSGLKPEEANRIASLLQDAMSHQKIFLQADISIEDLAIKLGVAKHHLSQVINKCYEKNYVDFINGWRLKEACSRLTNPKWKTQNISTIALDSGFNSVASFNKIFKRQFQVTPSQFREQNLKEMSA